MKSREVTSPRRWHTARCPRAFATLRTSNAIERLNRETRRQTWIVGTFLDKESALTLVAARLKYIADNEWGSLRYLDAPLLRGQPHQPATG